MWKAELLEDFLSVRDFVQCEKDVLQACLMLWTYVLCDVFFFFFQLIQISEVIMHEDDDILEAVCILEFAVRFQKQIAVTNKILDVPRGCFHN